MTKVMRWAVAAMLAGAGAVSAQGMDDLIAGVEARCAVSEAACLDAVQLARARVLAAGLIRDQAGSMAARLAGAVLAGGGRPGHGEALAGLVDLAADPVQRRALTRLAADLRQGRALPPEALVATAASPS